MATPGNNDSVRLVSSIGLILVAVLSLSLVGAILLTPPRIETLTVTMPTTRSLTQTLTQSFTTTTTTTTTLTPTLTMLQPPPYNPQQVTLYGYLAPNQSGSSCVLFYSNGMTYLLYNLPQYYPTGYVTVQGNIWGSYNPPNPSYCNGTPLYVTTISG